ncbi:MAG: hypothetical protein ACXWUG_14240 [Polyangiales bacterium]
MTAWFDRADTANRALIDLKAAGIDANRITVMASQTVARHDVALTEHTKAPEGGAAGAAVGAGVGALAGALALAGSLLIPGIGWIAGPLVGALVGAGAGGVTGGLVGALAGAGMPEHEAKVVEDTLRQGGVVIAVHATDRHVKDIGRILKDNGGRSLTRS